MSITFVHPTYLWLLLLIPLTISLGLIGKRASSRWRLWTGLTIRSFLLTAIIVSLAGIQLRLNSPSLTTVFVLDASDSILAEQKSYGEQVINEAITGMEPGDRAAIVVFGADALVERLAEDLRNTQVDISSVPVTTRTDIASALQLAQALLPPEGAKRIVLLSDGRQNVGEAIEQAELLASGQVELRYVPLGKTTGEAEALISSLEAPAEVRQGQTLALIANIESSQQTPATLRIYEEDRLIQTMELTLQVGANRVQIEVPTTEEDARSRFRRFRAQLISERDTRLQNNEAGAYTVVHGPPAILLIEGEPGAGENLAQALQASEMNITRIEPGQVPTGLDELAAYQAVLLANVPADALPRDILEALQVYVRDLGMGLVMIGGAQSFGAGGYLRTPLEKALPVDMDVRDKELEANLALVLAVDKSGSMDRCHCDNPDLFQSYTPTLSGQPKVDIAKEAIMRAAGALGGQDYLGVVAFDSQPHWVLDLARLTDTAELEAAISSFTAEGQTNLEAGLEAAYQGLQGVQARRKHIILMTDGWVRRGDLTPLANEMAQQGITLSVVAAGEGSADYLLALSQIGKGAFYPATDIFHVPDIFLKETVKSVGEYIIEEPFYPLPSAPSQVLRGIDETRLPPLLGYNGTTPKNTARLDLLTSRGDPLLATWQYGLGRSAAWTSDLRGQWGKEWVAWKDFPKFTSQLIDWVLPAPKIEGLDARLALENGNVIVHLDARDASGQPLNFLQAHATLVDPDLKAQELPLRQVGPGQYEASSETAQPGVYLMRLGINQGDQSLGQITLGLVAPYSPEYKSTGIDTGLLNAISQVTGGGLLLEPTQAFLHNLPSTAQAREIWQTLLLIAALLFPVDVALRRLVFKRRDYEKARQWIENRWQGLVSRPLISAGQPKTLGQLFEARDRARHRRGETGQDRPVSEPSSGLVPAKSAHDRLDFESGKPEQAPRLKRPEKSPPVQPSHQETSATGTQSQSPEVEASDSLARLREAKRRARKSG